MKRFLIPLVGALALTVNAQEGGADQLFETEAARTAREAAPVVPEEKLNEIKLGNFTYSGILLEALRANNPLQLLNPFAPPEYGSPEDNLVRDPIRNRPIGLKLFAIAF